MFKTSVIILGPVKGDVLFDNLSKLRSFRFDWLRNNTIRLQIILCTSASVTLSPCHCSCACVTVHFRYLFFVISLVRNVTYPATAARKTICVDSKRVLQWCLLSFGKGKPVNCPIGDLRDTRLDLTGYRPRVWFSSRTFPRYLCHFTTWESVALLK